MDNEIQENNDYNNEHILKEVEKIILDVWGERCEVWFFREFFEEKSIIYTHPTSHFSHQIWGEIYENISCNTNI